MTKREYKYFKFKKAFKILYTEKGIAFLKSKGIYPFTLEFKYHTEGFFRNGYLIDKKGNIIGTRK